MRIVVGLLCLLFLSSCNSYLSIQKRKYRDGYYVELIPRHTLFSKQDTLSSVSNEWLTTISDSLPAIREFKISSAASFVTDTLPETKKHRKNRHGPAKFEESKDVTKKELEMPVAVKLGVTSSVISFAGLIWILIGGFSTGLFLLFAICSLLGFVFSFMGWKQIVNSYDRTGKALAVAGVIINLIFLLFSCMYLGLGL